MQTKIRAGAEIDVITPDEMDAMLGRHLSHVTQQLTKKGRRVQSRIVIVEASVPGGGTAFQVAVSPAEGFLWQLCYVQTDGIMTNFNVYRSNVTRLNQLSPNTPQTDLWAPTGRQEVFLNSGEQVIVAGTGAANAVGNFAIAILEVPVEFADILFS